MTVRAEKECVSVSVQAAFFATVSPSPVFTRPDSQRISGGAQVSSFGAAAKKGAESSAASVRRLDR